MNAHQLVLDESWCSFTSIQGGLVVGVMLDAAVTTVAGRGSDRAAAAVRAVTIHFLGPVRPGVTIEVSVHPDRIGATGSNRVELRQAGQLRAVAQVLTSSRAGRGQPAIPSSNPSSTPVPPPDVGQEFELPVTFVPFAQHLQFRVLDGTFPNGLSAEPRLHAWVRVKTPLSPLIQLGVLVDALPPSVFATAAPMPLPTVELTAHLCTAPPPQGAWVCIELRTSWIADDVLVDDATLQDEAGTLVGRVRQTRRVPVRRTG